MFQVDVLRAGALRWMWSRAGVYWHLAFRYYEMHRTRTICRLRLEEDEDMKKMKTR